MNPLLPNDDVINSDWPAFATGARLIVSDPGHLYDFETQKRVELDVTGGRVLVTLGIEGILPFLAPAWVALLAVPFDAVGPEIGGRLWVLFGLLCLAGGLYFATRPRPPTAILPGFAAVPTALLLLAATGVALLGATLALNPHWVFDWLGQTRATVQPGSREVDLPHLGVLLPAGMQTVSIAVLTVAAITLVLLLARRRRNDLPAMAAVVIAGGVLASPHALPADLVLVALALALWGQARWFDWLGLSIAAVICALTPAPVPALVGVLVIGWVCLRAAGLVVTWTPREQAPASAR